MTQPSDYLSNDHRRCDTLWSRVEAAADDGVQERVESALKVFRDAMERHFAMEERVLFPAFEGATQLTASGPTPVMRAEHAQIRALMAQLEEVAVAGDLDRLFELGDTLLMLTQQHNSKEEGMLYKMMDRALMSEWPDLRERVTELMTTASDS